MHRSPIRRPGRDAGMVTAEAAFVIPVLLLVAVLCGWVVAVGAAQVRMIDAAREGARLAARGEPAAVVQAAIQQTGPAGATAQVHADGGTVTVDVAARVEPAVPLLDLLPGIDLHSSATSTLEGPDG